MKNKIENTLNQLIVHKPNQLIEIVGNPISTQGILVYNFLLHKLQSSNSDKITISMSEIFNSLSISDKYDQIYDYLDSLQKLRIESRDNKGKIWGAFNLLSAFHKQEDGGIFIQIPDPIYKALCGDNSEINNNLYYTTIQLLEQKLYSCSYSLVFFEIFKKYEKVNIPVFTVDELKKLTDTTTKYDKYKYFKRDVLTKSISELNKFDKKYVYSFEERKIGRKVQEIKFIRNEKKITQQIEKPIIYMSEKLIDTIKRAKKNIYVNKTYSQKAIDRLLTQYDEDIIIKALNDISKYNREIKNFPAFITDKINDIKNSTNKEIDKKLFILEEEEDIYKNKTEDDFIQTSLFNDINIDEIFAKFLKLDDYLKLKVEERALELRCSNSINDISYLLKIKENNITDFYTILKKQLVQAYLELIDNNSISNNTKSNNNFNIDNIKSIMLNQNKLDINNITDTIKKQIVENVEQLLQNPKDKLLFRMCKNKDLESLIDIYQNEFLISFNKFHSKQFLKNAKVTIEVTKEEIEKKMNYILEHKDIFVKQYRDLLLSKHNKLLFGSALKNRLTKLIQENIIKI